MKNQISPFLPFASLTEDELRAAHAEVVEEIDLSKLSHPHKTKILVVKNADAPYLNPTVELLSDFNSSDSSCEVRQIYFGWGATLANMPNLIRGFVRNESGSEAHTSDRPYRIHRLTANSRPLNVLTILPNYLKVDFLMSYDHDDASFTTCPVVGILLING